MLLHFNRAGVQRLIEHAKAATDHRATYAQKRPIKPGFWLVGDDGIYLLSNGLPGLANPKPDRPDHQFIVYAQECNPEMMAFEAWWAVKRHSFGGDDGVEYIALDGIEEALATYRPGEDLILDVSPQEIGIRAYAIKPPPRKTAVRKGRKAQ